MRREKALEAARELEVAIIQALLEDDKGPQAPDAPVAPDGDNRRLGDARRLCQATLDLAELYPKADYEIGRASCRERV